MKTENFKDGRNPQDKGDMARHGLKGKSISQLKKIRSSDTASKRKKQLAHWYINMHSEETNKKLMKKKTFKEYMYDYGTPEATKLAKKITPGQNEDRRERLRSKMADIGKQMGQTAAKIDKTIGKEPEPKMKKPEDSMFKTHPKYEGKKKGFTISKARSNLYKTAKTLGDISALRKKKVGQRIGRRIAGKIASRAMRSLF